MDNPLACMEPLIGIFQARAAALDADARFPAENIADLRTAGALTAPLPTSLSGLGWGTHAHQAGPISALLRLIGRGHLPTGRLFEGHVNAIRLAATYGDEKQMARVAADVQAGEMFGLWVTDGAGLQLRDGQLHGGKVFCSGAGHLRRAIVTAQPESGDPVLVLVRLDDQARATPSAMRLQGMRAAVTGIVDLTGLPAGAADIIGAPGDYLRQPAFSSGAWRTSAVTLGGIDALIEVAQTELASRRRAGDPHQLARMGEALIAQETAALWVEKASRVAEREESEAGDIAGYVNLARLAVEKAAMDAIRIIQRSLGLSAFVQGHPAERLMRDLATYLRQPAPDETMTEAAAWFSTRMIPA